MPYPVPPELPPVVHAIPHQSISATEPTEGIDWVAPAPMAIVERPALIPPTSLNQEVQQEQVLLEKRNVPQSDRKGGSSGLEKSQQCCTLETVYSPEPLSAPEGAVVKPEQLSWVGGETLSPIAPPELSSPEDERLVASTEASALGGRLSVSWEEKVAPIADVYGVSDLSLEPTVEPALPPIKDYSPWRTTPVSEAIEEALSEKMEAAIAQTPALDALPASEISPLNDDRPSLSTDEPESSSETPIPIESAEPEEIEIPIAPPGQDAVIELTADRQEFDDERQIFTAEGNVEMLLDDAILRSDKLQVNLINRLALAVGNVSLVSGEQILLGSRFLYNFVQGTGTIEEARGVVYIPTAGTDFDFRDDNPDSQLLPPGERILLDQPPTDVTDAGGVIINVGGGGSAATTSVQQGGQVRRVRFEAEQLDFTPEGWQATNIRFTNDPFSPPELEVRADRAQLTRISPLEDEVLMTRPRLVFDQRVGVPLLRNRLIISREERDPAIATLGFDNRDRGGLFIERSFEVIETRRFSLRLAPQFLVQRALGFSSDNRDADSVSEEDLQTDSFWSWIGLRASLDARLAPQTTFQANVNLAGFNNTGDTARANVQLQHRIANHTLSAEYTYRNRFYNGSLGFQTVDRSVGVVFASPILYIADTGIAVNYQASFQNIYAPTDRLDLLDPSDLSDDRVSLNRTQMSATVRRPFSLWKGEPLPPTPTEGLKYTPKPVIPYVQFLAGLTGTAGFYSNGESQSYLQGLMGFQGQFGHFSRSWLDYTGFSILYSQFIPTGESPFRFDRVADVRVLQLELNQQLYGPIRIAARAGFNLDTGKTISTDYMVEYSRRTYGLTFRYNPDLGLAALGFRLGDFNWSGVSESFSSPNIRQATPTVIQSF
ncbi:MAG: DUF3769 domain-containing protein [Roseofilum sp. SBFL]|uniref:DUF3769 domain-containing protein n=1 Tax=Roseofilum sp. SBFL TaxID=2821496 RepID=UPI001B1B9341|nr:DUF3769 domain-containing protein [Roseofilum sp. SBFL]MBP0041045.1 DUF3769 domain-containing protein [Roseofilum sp. SBFL]